MIHSNYNNDVRACVRLFLAQLMCVAQNSNIDDDNNDHAADVKLFWK